MIKKPRKETVKKRLQRGFSSEEAEHSDPNWEVYKKRIESPLFGSERGRGRTFKLPVEFDELFDLAVAESGKTANDWVAEAVLGILGSGIKHAVIGKING